MKFFCCAGTCSKNIPRTGVFFDADNVSHKSYERIIQRVTNMYDRRPIIMRAYKDCKDPSWVEACEKLGIESIHVPRVPKKNSSDIYMSLDMLETAPLLDNFVLVSNDMDFRHVLVFLKRKNRETVVVTCGGYPSPPLIPWCEKHVHINLNNT